MTRLARFFEGSFARAGESVPAHRAKRGVESSRRGQPFLPLALALVLALPPLGSLISAGATATMLELAAASASNPTSRAASALEI